MGKLKTVLCFLLGVMLIFPLAFAGVPAVKAEGEEPQEGIEATITPGGDLEDVGPPTVLGCYALKGKLKIYDSYGTKLGTLSAGMLNITCQNANYLTVGLSFPILADMSLPEGFPESFPEITLQSVPQAPCTPDGGIVGNILRKVSNQKAKNKPLMVGWWAEPTNLGAWQLLAKVYLEKESPYPVKKMKVRITGQIEWLPYEGKFTAVPVTCP